MHRPVSRSITHLGMMTLALAVVLSGDAIGAVHHPTPGHVRAATAGPHHIQLVWTAPVKARRFGVWKQGKHVALTGNRAYTFRGLTCGSSHRLGVRARYPDGGRSAIRWISARTSACIPAAPTCTAFADPSMNIATFVAGLAPGGVGCLAGGTYAGRVIFQTSDVTLQTAPGANAKCSPCEVEIRDSADNVTWNGIDLDASDYAGVVIALHVYGDDALVENSDIQDAQDHCVFLGSSVYGVAWRPRIVQNRIHNCGGPAPAFNEQALYMSSTRNAVIEDNTIYNTRDFGINMYDDAQGSLIARNIIDGARLKAGIAFGSTDMGQNHCSTNSGNIVRDNIITNNFAYAATDNATGCGFGTGDVVQHNCVWSNGSRNFPASHPGFTVLENEDADPLYVNRAAGDYRLLSGSPCAGDGPRP
jgi:parallel beta-helix repeat protein